MTSTPISLLDPHATALVSVEPFRGDREDWDRFVRTTPGATFFHLSGWKAVLEDCFGFRPQYLMARRGGEVAGVLPLFELGTLFLGRYLLSVPFAVEGGVCAADTEARRVLEETAVALGEQRRVRYLELRDGVEHTAFRMREGLYFRFRRELRETADEDLAAIRRKQRRMIRVGQSSGLTARVGDDQLDVFYDLYARSVRNLGTPVFPRRYFELLLRRFGAECDILTVWHGDTAAAAVLSFYFNGTVLPYYAGSRRELFRYAVNDFMYWELMQHARRRGMRAFDFGRSKKGTGAYDFKCHWGFAPEPLRYRVHLPRGGPLPDRSAGDGNLELLRRAWRRLPLGVTKAMGPFFIRHYGARYT